MPVVELRTAAELRAAHPVMAQLRPHLDRPRFVAQVRRQQRARGYRLIAVHVRGRCVALAGFRIAEFLAWGKILYVDDLVTDDALRSRGHGRALLRWLEREAQRNGCAEIHLDSGVQRFGAHRFYLREGFDITSHHFARKLAVLPV
jgi:GNAT superfamily N-acetyltransferase